MVRSRHSRSGLAFKIDDDWDCNRGMQEVERLLSVRDKAAPNVVAWACLEGATQTNLQSDA